MKKSNQLQCSDIHDLKEKIEVMENLERIENKVKRMHREMLNLERTMAFEVTDIPNFDQKETNIKKLKGGFHLVLNHQLPMAKRIEQFAVDPVSFHLHKQRNFVHKIKQEQNRQHLKLMEEAKAKEKAIEDEKAESKKRIFNAFKRSNNQSINDTSSSLTKTKPCDISMTNLSVDDHNQFVTNSVPAGIHTKQTRASIASGNSNCTPNLEQMLQINQK